MNFCSHKTLKLAVDRNFLYGISVFFNCILCALLSCRAAKLTFTVNVVDYVDSDNKGVCLLSILSIIMDTIFEEDKSKKKKQMLIIKNMKFSFFHFFYIVRIKMLLKVITNKCIHVLF